jgi:dextranase
MRATIILSLVLWGSLLPCCAQDIKLIDAYPDKARYMPGDTIQLQVDIQGGSGSGRTMTASLMDLGKEVEKCIDSPLFEGVTSAIVSCIAPQGDFRGYLVKVQVLSSKGIVLGERNTAIDVSSDWKRFPRYGYLAHYNQNEGARPSEWVAELNRFHINGLQFYDFQYRHDQPLAGTLSFPAPSWPDIANRETDRTMVEAFIREAHRRNMVAMAYDASYSAYEDVFTRSKNPLPLSWGVWSDAAGPRAPETVKSLGLPTHWATSKLYYMNQNDPEWQKYIFGQISTLLNAYPFDGWHIDTFGEQTAYAFNGSLVDFISGMPSYIDHAHAAIKKRVVMNAVNARGQERIAETTADFVYSELWETHETFASIEKLAEQVHQANPDKAYVLAAYVNRNEHGSSDTSGRSTFNVPAVLLTDATIFAVGASHIELGDGDRMLSGEYFPADTRLSISPELHQALRHYYDFDTAYENELRDGSETSNFELRVNGYQCTGQETPGKIWTIGRLNGDLLVINLLNMLGSSDTHWRDSTISRSPPPTINDLPVTLFVKGEVASVGWASPDVDGGSFHELPSTIEVENGKTSLRFTLPHLLYWDMLVIKVKPSA